MNQASDFALDYPAFSKRIRVDAVTEAPPQRLWDEITSIGGRRGWYYIDWLWQLRGTIDFLAGGVGMRRDEARKVPLHPGDLLDFYRVLTVVPERQLTLFVELRMPGTGVMEFRLTPGAERQTRIEIAAYFEPSGTLGAAYWISLLPLHRMIFHGLIRTIVRRAGSQPA